MKNLKYLPLLAISFLLVISSACSSDSDESEELINRIAQLQEDVIETQEQIEELSSNASTLEEDEISDPVTEVSTDEDPAPTSSEAPEYRCEALTPECGYEWNEDTQSWVDLWADGEDWPTSNVIVAAEGVLGWSVEGEWVEVDEAPVDPLSVPAAEGDLYRVLRVGSVAYEVNSGVLGSAPTEGCPPGLGGTVEISIDDPMFEAEGWPYTFPIAISSNWDLIPNEVELLDLDSEIYKGFASDLLAEYGLIDPDPTLTALVRTDLEGDGVDEVIIAAERLSGGSLLFPSSGDYSILFIRKLIGGEVTRQIFGVSVVPDDEDPESSFAIINATRLIAVADLNGDDSMEIVFGGAYYEGSSTHVVEMLTDEEGFNEVLSVGCGA